jgi:MraZ protein
MTDPVGAKPHKLDMAGRIKLRDEERAGLGDSMVMSRGFDNCIILYSVAAWGRLVVDFKRLPPHDPNVQDLKRLLIAPAEKCEVDGQGRVRLPEALMQWAGLGGGKVDALVQQVDEGRWECWESSRLHEFLLGRAPELKQFASGVFARSGLQGEGAKEEAN